MERSLLWISFGVGLAGWFCCAAPAFARRSRSRAPLPTALTVALVALPVLLLAVSLLGRAPFTAGCGFGLGYFLGGIASWMSLAALRLETRPPNSTLTTATRAAAAWLPVVPAIAGAQLLLRGNLIDTLAGIAIGWFCTMALVWIAAPRPQGEPPIPVEDLAGASVFTVLAAAFSLLASIRGGDAPESLRWAAMASVLVTAAPLAVLAGALPSGRVGMLLAKVPGIGLAARLVARRTHDDEARLAVAASTRAVLAGVVLCALARLTEVKFVSGSKALVEAKLFGLGQLSCCVTVGLAAAILIAWLVARPTADTEHSAPHSLLIALVVGSAFMLAFQLMTGFGCAAALLASWTLYATRLAAIAPDERPATAGLPLPAPLILGLLLVLYRLVEARFESDLNGGVSVDHYALFGILLGAAIPAILSARAERNDRPGIENAIVTALLVLAIPAVIVVVWGPKCVLALLVGLALSVALAPRWNAARVVSSLTAAVAALSMALAVSQWTSHAMRAAILTRAERVHILYWIAGTLIVVMLASKMAAAIAARRKRVAGEPGR